MLFEIQRKVLSKSICKRLIDKAEKDIDKNTLDSVDEEPVYEYTFDNLHEYCDVSALIQFASVEIKTVNYWIRQYCPTGRNKLKPHQDLNSQTINIALNDPSEYTGHGLCILERQNGTCKKIYPHLECGDAIIHSNHLWHSVENISNGVRWVLIIFINEGLDWYMKDLETKINSYDRELYQHYIEPKIMSTILCDEIIVESNKHRWTRKRHLNHPTTDIQIKSTNISNKVHKFVQDNVFTLIEKYYMVDKKLIEINDLFIVKYECSGQNFLEKHFDANVFSFVILLNEHTEFDGGGTGIYSPWGYQECHLSKGDIMLQPGFLYHQGIPITRGIRYILVGFLDIKNYTFVRNKILNMSILNYDNTDNIQKILDNPSMYISLLMNTQIDNINIVERGTNKRFSQLKYEQILIIIPKNTMKMKINNFLIDKILVFECCTNIKWHDNEEFQYILLEKKGTNFLPLRDEPNDGILLMDNVIDCEMCDVIINELDKHTENIPFKIDKKHYLDDCIYQYMNKIFFQIYNKLGLACNVDSGFVLQKSCNEIQFSSSNIQSSDCNCFYNTTIIVTLNDDYEGGEIYFPIQNFKKKLMKGQVIVFPPYWTHKYMFNSTQKNTYRYTITSHGGFNKK